MRLNEISQDVTDPEVEAAIAAIKKDIEQYLPNARVEFRSAVNQHPMKAGWKEVLLRIEIFHKLLEDNLRNSLEAFKKEYAGRRLDPNLVGEINKLNVEYRKIISIFVKNLQDLIKNNGPIHKIMSTEFKDKNIKTRKFESCPDIVTASYYDSDNDDDEEKDPILVYELIIPKINEVLHLKGVSAICSLEIYQP